METIYSINEAMKSRGQEKQNIGLRTQESEEKKIGHSGSPPYILSPEFCVLTPAFQASQGALSVSSYQQFMHHLCMATRSPGEKSTASGNRSATIRSSLLSSSQSRNSASPQRGHFGLA